VTVDLPGGSLAVVHGHKVWDCHDPHKRLRNLFPQARAIVYGHSHIRVCDLDSRPWVLNPGAAGRVRTHGGASCLVLHVNGDAWHVETLRFEPATTRRSA
jgi:predicted phosphodiesterase